MVTISILGLYQQNKDLFSGMVLPDGVETELVIGRILESCAELEALFSNPVYMQNSIAMWSRRNIRIWERLYMTTQLEYNPIENYRRVEKWGETGENSGIGKVTGYNSNELVTSNGSESTVNNSHDGLTYGNIGVTTTQKMISEEREVVKFNIYNYIADSFKYEYCLLVY